MPRQLSLTFRDEDRPSTTITPQEKSTTEDEFTEDPVQCVAEQLRPRVLAYLGQQHRDVGIHELRLQLGYPALDTEPDPQSNPVNRILKEMRDRGEVVCNEPQWGEPTFKLPGQTRPMDLSGSDQKVEAKRPDAGEEFRREQLRAAEALPDDARHLACNLAWTAGHRMVLLKTDAFERVRELEHNWTQRVREFAEVARIGEARARRILQGLEFLVVDHLEEEAQLPALLQVEAAEYKGNEAAKRAILIAAAWGHPVRLAGPEDQIGPFRRLAARFGVPVRDDEDSCGFAVPATTPTRREQETELAGTSTSDMQTSLGSMPETAPTDVAPDVGALLDAAIRALTISADAQESIRSVATAIARLAKADRIDAAHMAEAINYFALNRQSDSSFEESSSTAAPPLIRPDRQFTFDGAPHYDWPTPEEDRDTISVDRIREDIDGPSHRFLVKRGDTVEVFFSKDKLEIGEVVGISHANREVSVRFRDGTNGIWFAVGCIYPACEPLQDRSGVPLSEIAENASQPPANGFSEADRVEPACDSQGGRVESLAPQHRTFRLSDFRELLGKLEDGSLTFDEWKAEYQRLKATQAEFVGQLKKERTADQLKALASRFGCFDAKRNSKQKNAGHVLRAMLQWFTLSASVQYNPMSETLSEAVDRVVEGITTEDFARYLAEQQQDRQDREQAMSDPQTFEQFRLYLREHSYQDLTTEQQARWDRLMADQTRQRRREQRSKRIVEQVVADDADELEVTIIEGRHTKQDIPLWICQLSKRVSADTFRQLKIKAKQLDGWWSSFVRGQEGFQFKTPEAAQQFQSLLEGSVDRTAILDGRRSRKMESASERLESVAETLESEAESILSSDSDKLKNTVRRSEMAAGMRGRAYANQAMAKTLRSIADTLGSEDAQYLDGLRASTHVETLISLLRRGKRDRNARVMKNYEDNPENTSPWDRHCKFEQLDNRPCLEDDVAFVGYPFPEIYKRHLEELLVRVENRRGLKKISTQIRRHLITDRHYASFVDDGDVGLLEDFVQRCKAAGQETRWVESGMEDYKRLRAADIHTPHELRAVLREILPHLKKKAEDDPVVKLEQQLIGREIAGFFPTPKSIISRMLELAEIGPGNRVLEPSAGKGDILDMIRDQRPDVDVTAIEINSTLHEILAAKGHNVQQADFLEHCGQYDCIVMNPPFANGQDIDHVRHAFKQLAPSGRLVAVMSAGPFFRSDRKASDFRDWIESIDATIEDLPDDAFKGAEAFRQTGVRTKLVVLSQPPQ